MELFFSSAMDVQPKDEITDGNFLVVVQIKTLISLKNNVHYKDCLLIKGYH